MNLKQNNFLLILSLSIILIITACSGGGNRDIMPEPFNINNITGDWLFDANCDSALVLGTTIFLAEQLPDTITINSDTDSTIFIDAGANNLVANVDSNGNFTIDYQSFRAYLDLGFLGADTATIYLTGTGSFSSNYGASMDLTFSEPLLSAQIDCTIGLRKLE